MNPVEAYKILNPSGNAFCPTGKGGGKDPTCSPGKSGRSSRGGTLREKKDTAKSARAKASHNPATKEKQDESDRLEVQIADMLGGERTGDNKPMDVIVRSGKNEIGLEVKMFHDTKHDKVTIRKGSRQRKDAWLAAKKNRKIYTVAVDNRDKFAGGKHSSKYSGNKVYFREGAGSFRLTGMEKASSLADLRKKLL